MLCLKFDDTVTGRVSPPDQTSCRTAIPPHISTNLATFSDYRDRRGPGHVVTGGMFAWVIISC